MRSWPVGLQWTATWPCSTSETLPTNAKCSSSVPPIPYSLERSRQRPHSRPHPHRCVLTDDLGWAEDLLNDRRGDRRIERELYRESGRPEQVATQSMEGQPVPTENPPRPLSQELPTLKLSSRPEQTPQNQGLSAGSGDSLRKRLP